MDQPLTTRSLLGVDGVGFGCRFCTQPAPTKALGARTGLAVLQWGRVALWESKQQDWKSSQALAPGGVMPFLRIPEGRKVKVKAQPVSPEPPHQAGSRRTIFKSTLRNAQL